MNKVTIKALENGPFIVEVDENTVSVLCRCGKSENKPNCDGTHAKIGFQANSSEIKII